MKGGLFTDFTDKNAVYVHSKDIIYGTKKISDKVKNIKIKNYLSTGKRRHESASKRDGSKIVSSRGDSNEYNNEYNQLNYNPLSPSKNTESLINPRLLVSNSLSLLPTKHQRNSSLESVKNVMNKNHLFRIKSHFENLGLIN